MASVVQICNIALTRIGQSKLIDSLAERSVAAEMCTLHYEACRDEVLRDFDWPFAEARVALAGIGQPPSNWTFRYRLPDNCLKARSIAVPGTVAIAGFNDLAGSDQMLPPLTTVRTPRAAMGEAGARMLLALMQGQLPESNSVNLGFELTVREST